MYHVNHEMVIQLQADEDVLKRDYLFALDVVEDTG
jgi:hypothetical protein